MEHATVDQEVGGSSPPSCTIWKSHDNLPFFEVLFEAYFRAGSAPGQHRVSTGSAPARNNSTTLACADEG